VQVLERKADRKAENSSEKPNNLSEIPTDSEKPNNCDTCRHKGVEGCEQPCLGCGCCGLYEAMTENDKLKEKSRGVHKVLRSVQA
jgi:hypothetical protein